MRSSRRVLRTPRVVSVLGVLLGAIALPAGCSTETARSASCYPGDYELESLADGGSRFLKCGPEGGSYAPYDGPDPFALPDANVGDSAGRCSTASGAKLPFMCPGCVTAGDCAPGLDCIDFPNKGGYLCTALCNTGLCVAPYSAGCGNNGHCKP